MANRQLKVEIVRFTDAAYPGWVATEFMDANRTKHAIVDKVPIFTTYLLDENSGYPRAGSIECVTLSEWKDNTGRKLVRISLLPGFESADGSTEFVVFSDQVL